MFLHVLCRFDMTYVAADASKQRPIMIHRAIFGSMERFFGILVENYAGAFPLWLAPVQARLLPVNDAVVPYVQEVRQYTHTVWTASLNSRTDMITTSRGCTAAVWHMFLRVSMAT